MKYLPVTLLMLSSLAYGAEDCSKIENTHDRLACFDKKFPSAEPATMTPGTETRATPEMSTEIDPVPESVAISASESSKTEAVTETAEEPSKTSILNFFSKREVEFTATVKDVLNNDQQKMAFLLSNNQIWIQNTPRNLPIRKGDEVTVQKGSVGGFIMRTTSGTSTRVSRIE